jgi:hypothetical protein
MTIAEKGRLSILGFERRQRTSEWSTAGVERGRGQR